MSKARLAWLLNSWAYKKARSLVAATVAAPERLTDLVGRAQAIKALSSGKFSDIAGQTKAAFRLVRAYAKGDYRDISIESFGLIVASIIYFVMPVDVLPDFIVALGFIDDAALLTWTLNTVANDIDRFIRWEKDTESVLDAEYQELD